MRVIALDGTLLILGDFAIELSECVLVKETSPSSSEFVMVPCISGTSKGPSPLLSRQELSKRIGADSKLVCFFELSFAMRGFACSHPLEVLHFAGRVRLTSFSGLTALRRKGPGLAQRGVEGFLCLSRSDGMGCGIRGMEFNVYPSALSFLGQIWVEARQLQRKERNGSKIRKMAMTKKL